MTKLLKTTALVVTMAVGGISHATTETLMYNNQLEFTGLNDQVGYELRLRLPQGSLKSLYLNPSQAVMFNAADFGITAFEDGFYKYELVPLKTSQQFKRDQSTKASAQDISSDGTISGVFTVKNGVSLMDQDEEIRDQVILDDLIVDGSACIGQDCVNGEAFGFDTLRLKENNLRIKFDDTSNSGSFPNNDWELTANDSANGGANRFSITDSTAGRTPFTVEAGARNNALYVEADGDVGFGTNNPVVDLHVVEGNTPTLRLNQDSSQGWASQTWDLAGNETNFFIRDVTNGSALPFRIQPGAPSNSIYIKTGGNVGLGTSAPDSSLHVHGADGSTAIKVTEGSQNQAARTLLNLTNFGNPEVLLENTATNKSWTLSAGNKFVLKNDAGETIMTIDTNGNMVLKGTITTEGL